MTIVLFPKNRANDRAQVTADPHGSERVKIHITSTRISKARSVRVRKPSVLSEAVARSVNSRVDRA